jgi:hypothetical protein
MIIEKGNSSLTSNPSFFSKAPEVETFQIYASRLWNYNFASYVYDANSGAGVR